MKGSAPPPAGDRPALSPMAWLLTGGIVAYEWTLRPVIGANCRFFPSCSAYAKEALAVHGAARGSLLAARRILRCNPWNEGGLDPVPPCTCAGGDGPARKA
jgi:putative membrane protein insertion efficiency factor